MTSKVIYTGALRTEAEHLRSGTKIVTDAPVDNQGLGAAFSPTDLVATALASCMLTIMGIKARDHGINMDGASAEVNKIMSSAPRRIARVEIAIQMPHKAYSEEEKEVLTEAAKGCPVCRSLSSELEVDLSFHWASND